MSLVEIEGSVLVGRSNLFVAFSETTYFEDKGERKVTSVLTGSSREEVLEEMAHLYVKTLPQSCPDSFSLWGRNKEPQVSLIGIFQVSFVSAWSEEELHASKAYQDYEASEIQRVADIKELERLQESFRDSRIYQK